MSLARLRQATGPHWAATAKGGGRSAGPLGFGWVARGKEKKRKRVGWAGSRVSWVSAHSEWR
jgi:hypothetical protein